MKALIDLYDAAFLNDVAVVNFQMTNRDGALSVMDEDGYCYIALDTSKLHNAADETVKLAHDLGHCMTGAFYNRHSSLNAIGQQEHKANRWAVHRLLPFEDLQSAFAGGITTRWELADRFEVTEDFIDLAVQIYEEEGKMQTLPHQPLKGRYQ